jgi:hypothetical protein
VRRRGVQIQRPNVFSAGANGTDSERQHPVPHRQPRVPPTGPPLPYFPRTPQVSRNDCRHGPSPFAYSSSSSCRDNSFAATAVVGPSGPGTVTLQLAAAGIVRVANTETCRNTSSGGIAGQQQPSDLT